MIAPTVLISEGVTIGGGAVLCDAVIVDTRAFIGRHFQANFFSYVGHDCRIGDFVTLSPRVGINGDVHVGDGCFFGAGAIVCNGTRDRPLRIGRGVFVAIGAVVTGDVPDGAAVGGNPCTDHDEAHGVRRLPSPLIPANVGTPLPTFFCSRQVLGAKSRVPAVAERRVGVA